MEWQNLIDFLEDNGQKAFDLLEEIVNIDSPSRNKAGTNKVGQALCRYLERFQIPYEIRRNEKYGDHIIATVKGSLPGKILLMGHMDTVFANGTATERPFSMDDEHAYGPGVADMKAGLVSILFAAAAIKHSACEHCDIELLYTPDEEIGSPSSRAIIEKRARDAIAVFNAEPGRPDGSVVTGRKGSAHLEFHIEGRAAHSGLHIEQGISAIEELGHKIIELRKCMDMERGITVNVGLVQGGVNTNVVAPHASGTIHLGFWSVEDFVEVMDKVRSIMNTSYVPGTQSVLRGDISFMPMDRHEGVASLYQIVQEAASLLAIPITEQRAKGAADSGFTASMGVPTICGMGPVGGKYHNEEEYMVKDSFLPRMKLLAASVIMASQRLAKRGREQ